MSIIETQTLWIKEARLGFPAIIAPKAVQGGEPKFGANFILPVTAVEWAEMCQIVGAIATEKWGDNAGGVMNLIGADKRLRCYGQGEEKLDKLGKVWDGFAGMLYISASNDAQPKLYGQNAQELPPTANANQLFTGGNYVSGIISFWLQDNTFGRAVRANLDGIQYIREGEHFGATGPDTDAIFTAVAGAPATTAAAPGMPGMVAPVTAIPGMYAPQVQPQAATVQPQIAPAPVTYDFL